jgi:hypothetical protein
MVWLKMWKIELDSGEIIGIVMLLGMLLKMRLVKWLGIR